MGAAGEKLKTGRRWLTQSTRGAEEGGKRGTWMDRIHRMKQIKNTRAARAPCLGVLLSWLIDAPSVTLGEKGHGCTR